MRVLVTGSNGFIGHHVCDYLKKRNFYVIGLGRSKESRSNTDSYYCCDMSTEKVEVPFVKEKIDAVVHLAADMRREPYTVDVVLHNCVGTERILKLCTKYGVGVFTELSSLPVIGNPKEHPITETHSLRPYTVYHCTKIMEELLADYEMDMFGLRTSSFRISAPIGIGMNPNTIFSVFVQKAIANEPITIIGKGLRKQTYIHVNDISQAIFRAITNENAKGVYNLSSYNFISNIALAEKIIEITQSKSQIIYSETEDKEENNVWDVSIEKIQSELEFEPLVSIEYAIKELADYYRTSLEIL